MGAKSAPKQKTAEIVAEAFGVSELIMNEIPDMGGQGKHNNWVKIDNINLKTKGGNKASDNVIGFYGSNQYSGLGNPQLETVLTM